VIRGITGINSNSHFGFPGNHIFCTGTSQRANLFLASPTFSCAYSNFHEKGLIILLKAVRIL